MKTQTWLENGRARLDITFRQGADVWQSPGAAYIDLNSSEISNQWLKPTEGSPGRPNLEWPRLLMHNWDVNFISGISRWNWRDYGFWFQRQNAVGPIYFAGSTFTSWYNLDRGGDHPHQAGIGWSQPPSPELCINDGRPADLSIFAAPTGGQPSQDVHLDFFFLDFSGKQWRGGKVIRPWEFWVDDLDLNPYSGNSNPPGSGTIRWPRFYLHTWNTRHASGWSEWSGRKFGLFFKNGQNRA
jgi:hypothetical protein